MSSRKILLITQEKHYKTSEQRVPQVFASGNTKWLKIFKELGEILEADMYSFRPKAYVRHKADHAKNIRKLNENEVALHTFDLVYVHRQESLEIFNSLNLNFKRSILWAESCNFKFPINKIDYICHCSVNEFLYNKDMRCKNILTPNFCNGVKIAPKLVSRKKREKVVFIGRLTPMIIKKINILSSHFKHIQFDIYGSKFFYKNNKYIGLGPHCKDRVLATNRLHEMLPGKNIVLKNIIPHGELYSVLNDEAYFAGLTFSVHDIGSKTRQVNSSSKFYDYIGAGIPVLTERIVPESFYVKKDANLGVICPGYKAEGLIDGLASMVSKEFDYQKIIRYANNHHSAKSRAKEIFKHVKEDK